MSLPWLGDLSVKAGIDYEGQKETHALYRQIVVVATSIGFLIGFFLQNFNVTVYIASSGFLLSLFVCLPPWGRFRSHPLPFPAPSQLQQKVQEIEKQTPVATKISQSKKVKKDK
eukprot:TRINITY_DN103_c0_g1_i5.p1 TRINITY_DN103_c0_g1~~TRINITY_DN103_c0_g1_i5.p1  ORF type:complete len:114 (+),score=16.88 TRINITY_DN103_c0_g1_i5:158-499(+)